MHCRRLPPGMLPLFPRTFYQRNRSRSSHNYDNRQMISMLSAQRTLPMSSYDIPSDIIVYQL